MKRKIKSHEVHMILLMVDILRELFDADQLPPGVNDYDDFAQRLLSKDPGLDLRSPGIARALQAWSALIFAE